MPRPGGVPLDDQHRREVCWQVLAQHRLRRLLQRQQRCSAGGCVCVREVSVRRWAEDAPVRGGFFFCFPGGRKLTCSSMPIISAIRKTDKANHRRLSGPQHILLQSKLLCHGILYDTMTQPFFFFLWKKAYMSIDANHISTPKDSQSKPLESVGSTAHPMTREAASPWHDVRYDDSTLHGALPPEGAKFHTRLAPGVR